MTKKAKKLLPFTIGALYRYLRNKNNFHLKY